MTVQTAPDPTARPAEPPPDAQLRPAQTRVPLFALLFIGLFGLLLASFPARNPDFWQHLASGRDLVRGLAVGPTWLYDLVAYAVYSAGGGATLVAVKAIICGTVAVLLLLLARADRGWRVALCATGLAVLAMG